MSLPIDEQIRIILKRKDEINEATNRISEAIQGTEKINDPKTIHLGSTITANGCCLTFRAYLKGSVLHDDKGKIVVKDNSGRFETRG